MDSVANVNLVPFLDGKPKRMLIGASWCEARSGKTFDSIDPATGRVLASIAEGDKEDVHLAVVAARAAFDGPWRKMKPFERQELLLRLATIVDENYDELARLDTLDMGAPLSGAAGRKRRAISLLRYYAGAATMLHGDTVENSIPGGDYVSYTLKQPVGVVGAIIPWNGPVGSAIWKIAPALATGCTIVLKPAEEASLSVLRLGELALEAGVPAGVLNIVTGFGETAGAALAAHEDVDKIAFTGSHVTGQKIVAASAGNLKRVTLELGGKSPDIVFADADLDAAVPGAAMAVFANSGQVCSAGTRLFVEQSIRDEFVARVAEFAKKLRVGNGLNPETQIGPLVSKRQFQRVNTYIESGLREGANVAYGREPSGDELANGYFVMPTVFENVRDEMTIAREEIFGPVLSTFSFEDMDDLVRRSNSTIFGLGSGVWTSDLSKAHTLANRIHTGNVWVNCYNAVDVAMPFGGVKMSGYGRESGRESLDEYLTTKSVTIKIA